MKVRDLVAILMDVDQESQVAIWDDEQYCAIEIETIDSVRKTYMNGFGGILINATEEIRNEQS